LGGFASGLRFSGDAEFLRRAQHVAKVANVSEHLYFRRIRRNSLTTAPTTGLKTPERERVMKLLHARARDNAERVACGEQPDLRPIAHAAPVGLRRLAGPPLLRAGETPRPRPSAPAAAPARRGGAPRPVFVIGAPRCGASALAWALGQHPSLPGVIETSWLADLAAELPAVFERSVAGERAAPISAERFSRTFGRAAAALVGDRLDRWVDCAPEHTLNVPALAKLFPEAVFIHVVRDADAAVRAVVDPPLGSAASTGGTQIPAHLRERVSEREAVRRWTQAALAGAEAESALGEQRVLRATYDELLEAPEVLLRRVLEFVGEPYDARCLRPLRGIRPGVHDDAPARAPKDAAHAAALAAARALSAELTGVAAATAPRTPGSRTRMSEQDVARLSEKTRRAARDVIGRLVPEGATVAIASRGDEEILRIPGRTGRHFPDGGGRPPQTAEEAVAQVAALREHGAQYLYFPFTALWWLEQLPGLREHLERDHHVLAHEEDGGVLFELGPRAETVIAPSAPSIAAAGGGPRVVMVTDHFPKFSETFFVNKFRELRARGWDVHVVCNRSNADQWEYFPGLREDPDLQCRLHPAKDFERTLSELAPALVHFGYGTLALGRMRAVKALGARAVVSFRGYDINYHGLEDPGCYQEVWEGADMLHCVGNDIWQRAQRRGCPADVPHVVITDAVDVSRFTPPPRVADSAGSAERPLRILSVGRLHWKKGHELGLTAIRALVDAGVAVTYRIMGDGPHREATLFAIHDLGLADHVELWGAQPAATVCEQLAWADVFLHPAVSEGFCVSAIEAQAMALPVVCSDADGLSENVVDGETGFVVSRRETELLAQRLATLAADGELRVRLGANARRRATTAFDATTQTDGFERLYRELLAAPVAAPAPARANGNGNGNGASRAVDASLASELEAAERRAAQLRREVFARQVVGHVHELAATALPPGATVLVISRGDDALVELADCRGWHFPQADGGAYAGHHPADSDSAIEHLEDLRARGAEFLVVPATSDWWLEYYAEFARHLDTRYARVAERDGGYVLFSLAARRA
ncbi:MAG TPA: glycosyltransferase, partial [Solirubrobacteraceae bacterium]|nr:glycosyltransferase [Solirubrobacteraceae bacterium]